MLNRFGLLIASTILASCAFVGSHPERLRNTDPASAVNLAYDERAKHASVGNLDDVTVQRAELDAPSFRYLYMGWWLAPSDMRNGDSRKAFASIHDAFTRLCSQYGQFDAASGYCLDDAGPLFVVRLVPSRNGMTAQIQVVERKGGTPSAEFTAALDKLGLQGPAVRQARQQALKAEYAQQQAHFDANQARIGDRGTKVCSNDEFGWVLVGFVDDATNDRLRILLKAKIRLADHAFWPGFKEETIWAAKADWYVCERS